MSTNNISSVSDALKYINNIEGQTETSISEDVKASVFNPVTAIFGGLESHSAIKAVGGKEGLKTVVTDKSIFNQLAKSADYYVGKAEKDAIEKAGKKLAEKGAQKGIFQSLKGALSSGKSFIGKLISKIPGASFVKGGMEKLGATSFGKVLKGTGAVGMAIFDEVFGIMFEVVPAFKEGGFFSGIKQFAKTTFNSVGSGLGWAGGSVAGKAIGATLGSFLGPVGTVVGGAVGTFLGGMVGSAIARGVSKKIAGKSEVEKIQDKQFEQTAAMVMQDSNAMNELNSLVKAKVEQEIQSGTADEETEKMAKYLNEGALSPNTSNLTPSNNTNYQPENLVDTTNTTDVTNTTDTTNTTNTTDITNATDTQSQTDTDNSNYWDEMAKRISEGDTSMYVVSNDRLDSVFANPKTAPDNSDNKTIDTPDGLEYKEPEEQVNYFAMA